MNDAPALAAADSASPWGAARHSVVAAGLLSPMLASAAMAFSSVSAALNSLRLRRRPL